MYQAIGLDTKRVYVQGSRADCHRLLNERFPYIVSEKNQGGWGRGNIVTDKPIFDEPLKIIKTDRKLMKKKDS